MDLYAKKTFFATGKSKKSSSCCLLSIGLSLVYLIWLTYSHYVISKGETNFISLCSNKTLLFQTGPNFLSFALDTEIILNGLNKFDTSNEKLISLVRLLGPGYLRIGGKYSDNFIFVSSKDEEQSVADKSNENHFKLFGDDWLELNKFAEKTDKTIIFGLNALLRNANGSWNSENAEEIISFSDRNNLFLHWELGNEPNSFIVKYNQSVDPKLLAADFGKLRQILNQYDRFRKALIIGPDVTRPIHLDTDSVQYLAAFLDEENGIIDAISWHQYYLNGREATKDDFLNPEVFNYLDKEIDVVKNLVEEKKLSSIPLWLGETSTAYGGGALGLSDSFIGGFLWIDKLGLAASKGIETVIRQTIFGGHYGLINDHYEPNPDWWISAYYQRFVGRGVLNCSAETESHVRFYCHCSPRRIWLDELPSITIFGLNMNSAAVKVRLNLEHNDDEKEKREMNNWNMFEYVLTPHKGILSRNVLLNDRLLVLPGDGQFPNYPPRIKNFGDLHILSEYSIVYWVVHGIDIEACY